MRLVLRLALTGVSVLAIAACGSSGSPPSSPAGGGPSAVAPTLAASSEVAGTAAASACQKATSTAGAVPVTIKDFSFNPGAISAKVGQPITFTNQDSVIHGAALDDGSCTTGSFGNGKTGSLVFSQAGTYTFHCPVHPTTMTGTIEITG